MITLKLNKKILLLALTLVVLLSLFSVSVFADETGDVAGAVEDTWLAAREQIKDVVNNVVFPVIDVVLAVLFFTKVATAYLDYRKHGQFEWVHFNKEINGILFIGVIECRLFRLSDLL